MFSLYALLYDHLPLEIQAAYTLVFSQMYI